VHLRDLLPTHQHHHPSSPSWTFLQPTTTTTPPLKDGKGRGQRRAVTTVVNGRCQKMILKACVWGSMCFVRWSWGVGVILRSLAQPGGGGGGGRGEGGGGGGAGGVASAPHSVPCCMLFLHAKRKEQLGWSAETGRTCGQVDMVTRCGGACSSHLWAASWFWWWGVGIPWGWHPNVTFILLSSLHVTAVGLQRRGAWWCLTPRPHHARCEADYCSIFMSRPLWPVPPSPPGC